MNWPSLVNVFLLVETLKYTKAVNRCPWRGISCEGMCPSTAALLHWARWTLPVVSQGQAPDVLGASGSGA